MMYLLSYINTKVLVETQRKTVSHLPVWSVCLRELMAAAYLTNRHDIKPQCQ